MKIIILTLFPKMFEGFLSESIIGRAQKNKTVEIEIINLRNWAIGKHLQVDDTPYGGGAGMVLKVDVVAEAIKAIKSKIKNRKTKVILLTPQGKTFNQKMAQQLSSSKNDILLICGHYEGFDERIRDYVDLEISIGDYILTGGELAAAVIADTVVRLLPGVLGKKESHQRESFSLQKSINGKTQKLLEFPQYTRPEIYDGKKVPKILLSGHHAEIEKWREAESIKRTIKRRQDLIK